MRPNGGPLAVATLLAGLAAAVCAGSAPAEENCLAAPNAPAPGGSHWYFHFDRAKNRKCWHLRAQGDSSEPANVATRPADQSSKSATEPLAYQQIQPTSSPSSELTAGAGQTSAPDAGAPRSATADAAAWPADPSPVPSPAAGATWFGPPPTTHKEPVADATPPQAPNVDDDAAEQAGPQTAAPVVIKASPGETHVVVLFVIVMVLVIVGILAAAAVKMLFRRLRIAFINRRNSVALDAARKLVGG